MYYDYGFFKNKKDDTDNVVNVLVTKDRRSTGVYADVAPRQGMGCGLVVKQMDRNLKKFGYHSNVVIRIEGGFAIQDFLDKLSSMCASKTI